MKRTIIFHVGFPKTATTWLQRHFFIDNPNLIFLGKPVPDCLDERTFYEIFRSIALTPYQNYDGDNVREKFQNWLDQIVTENKTDSPICVSYEKLARGINRYGLNSFYVARRLRDLCPEEEFDVRCLFTVRNQLSALPSYYSDYMIHGGTRNFKEFMFSDFSQNHPVLPFLKYEQLISRYEEIFGEDNVRVYPMEGLLRQEEEIIADLFEVLKLPARQSGEDLSTKKNPNPKLSVLGLGTLRQINHLFESEFNSPSAVNPLKYLLRLIGWILAKKRYKRDDYSRKNTFDSEPHYRGWLQSSLQTASRQQVRNFIMRLDRTLFHGIGISKPKLDEEMKRTISRYYRESNRTLNKHKNLQLEEYDYPL